MKEDHCKGPEHNREFFKKIVDMQIILPTRSLIGDYVKFNNMQ